jgi:RNA polymerase sigma-70 factor, ECF subfamily
MFCQHGHFLSGPEGNFHATFFREDHLTMQNIDKQDGSEGSNDFSLDALKARDRDEFARLVDAFSNKIYRVALKIVNDPQDAEDVLQETFIKAYRSLPAFEGRSSLSTWLYRIAVNEALMIVRKRKVDAVSLDEEKDSGEEEVEPVEIADWCCLPERDLLSVESRKFLDLAMQSLSPALRAVFVLRDIEGLSVKETADALGLSEPAVKTRLLRARLKLREELSVYFTERYAEKFSE